MMQFRLVLLLIACYVATLRVQAIDDDDIREPWNTFKRIHNKTYSTPEEEDKARGCFEKNFLQAALHNMKDEQDFDKDVHEYSDMCPEEQIEELCGVDVPANISEREMRYFMLSERQLPDSVDWTAAGKVSPVQNQGKCGSCWAFAAAQAVEGAVAILNGDDAVSLSEQQLVDCSTDYGNDGCEGGWPPNAFDFIEARGVKALKEEQCYPYTATVGRCMNYKSCKDFKITGYECVPSGDETAVMQALSEKGPLACALYVSDHFTQYSDGIYYDKSYTDQEVNHGVLLTGYGKSEDGTPFWIVKNSWGPTWGENGYIRIMRDGKNHLKLASYCCYPTLE